MEEASNGGGGQKGLRCGDSKHLDVVFNELMSECKHSAPGARLSARVRSALERLRPEERRALVSRTRDGCAPLFVASRRGNLETVEYLLHVCDADIEQRGTFEVPDDRSSHRVTPLWCAAVAGQTRVVRALADAGAQLDAPSDSGSTPVRSACFMTHLDVVRLLVERGADIHKSNYSGGTCLINAVQSARLCAYLLERGADADARDTQLKTALHYAIQEHRIETVKVLLEHGADPHLRSRCGDDALRTACIKGATQIAKTLLARVAYPPAHAADALEVLGATQLDEFNDQAGALVTWRRATALRHAGGAYARKAWARAEDEAAAARALGGAREWRSERELLAAADDVDALRAHALLVVARVLGAAHKDTLFRLMYRGAAYADTFRYQRCIDLWMWALETRVANDSLLYPDTSQTASALTRLLLDAEAGRLDHARGLPRAADVLRAFRLLTARLPQARAGLAARPVHRKQAETFDRVLRCVTHLLHLALRATDGPGEQARAERARLEARVRRLLAADVRSAHTGDTLLHLCVSRLNVVRSTYFADEIAVPPVFPSLPVVRLLLRCGAAPGARNEARSTPLHVAAIPYNFSTELVEELLAGGAHLDQPNKFGDSALEMVAANRGSALCPLRHTSLACLAARALLAAPPARPALPATLLAFLDLHRP